MSFKKYNVFEFIVWYARFGGGYNILGDVPKSAQEDIVSLICKYNILVVVGVVVVVVSSMYIGQSYSCFEEFYPRQNHNRFQYYVKGKSNGPNSKI